MDISGYAQNYIQDEVDYCESVINSFDDDKSTRDKLKELYSASKDKETIYCESGDLDDSISLLGPDKEFIYPIFPYRHARNLESDIAPLKRIIKENKQEQRILPIIQHPEYYVDQPHLRYFLEEVSPPSYFLRGQYAYSILLDIEPNMTDSMLGMPQLTKIEELKTKCLRGYEDELDNLIDIESCWEHRWKRQDRRGSEEFRERLRNSLSYRYASVSLCIGEKAVDEIIEIYETEKAWKILLYLHIIFDHVITHGFGSDYSVSSNNNKGVDFLNIKDTISENIRCSVTDITVRKPTSINDYFRNFLEESHFLIDFDMESIDIDSIEDSRNEITHRVKNYNRKVETMYEYNEMSKNVLSISLLSIGTYQIMMGEAPTSVLGVILNDDRISQLPISISDAIVDGLKKIEKKNLKNYIIQNAF